MGTAWMPWTWMPCLPTWTMIEGSTRFNSSQRVHRLAALGSWSLHFVVPVSVVLVLVLALTNTLSLAEVAVFLVCSHFSAFVVIADKMSLCCLGEAQLACVCVCVCVCGSLYNFFALCHFHFSISFEELLCFMLCLFLLPSFACWGCLRALSLRSGALLIWRR